MSEFDERQEAVQAVAEPARLSLSGLFNDLPDYQDQIERLEAVLAYPDHDCVSLGLRLVGDDIYANLLNTVTTIRDQAQSSAGSLAGNLPGYTSPVSPTAC